MRRSEAVRSSSTALYVDSLATSDRGSSVLPPGHTADMVPLLKMNRRDRKRMSEPSPPPPPPVYSRGPRTRLGAPARLAAAKAVVKGYWLIWPQVVLLYRWMELCANFVCLAGLLWVINPLVMLVPFILLWYLPAAHCVDSFIKPLKVPLLLFVVDDFSLLGIHPDARNVRFMYIISLLRVLLLLFIIPVCSKWSPLPQGLKDQVMNQAVMDIFVDEAPDTLDEPPEMGKTIALAEVWLALGLLALFASLMWMLLTLPMLCGSPCCGCPSPLGGWKDENLLKKVEELSAKVDNASGLEPSSCRKALERLRKDDCSRLQITTTFGVGLQAFGILSHLAGDVVNTCTFILNKDFIYAGLLSFTLAITLVYQCGAMGGGPLGIMTEAKLSIERGLYTENYLVIVQGDKGVQAIPAMALKIYGLPFAAKSPFSVLVAAASICGGVLGIANFIFQQYDLGVEREGLEPASTLTTEEQDLEPDAADKEDGFPRDPSMALNEEGTTAGSTWAGGMSSAWAGIAGPLPGQGDIGRGHWTPPPPPPPWEHHGKRRAQSSASSSTRRSQPASSTSPQRGGRAQTVRLDTSAGTIDIVVRHDWAPHGARRFLELVAGGHFDGLYIYRAVNRCVAQFGLPSRRPWHPLPDDRPQGVPFLFGAVGFVSSGYETRQSAIFICLGDMSHCIGQKPWEVPIGAVSQSTLQTLDRINTQYGDIKEFEGRGPEVARILSEGNSYLRTHFPHLTQVWSAWLLDAPRSATPEDLRGPSGLPRSATSNTQDAILGQGGHQYQGVPKRQSMQPSFQSLADVSAVSRLAPSQSMASAATRDSSCSWRNQAQGNNVQLGHAVWVRSPQQQQHPEQGSQGGLRTKYTFDDPSARGRSPEPWHMRQAHQEQPHEAVPSPAPVHVPRECLSRSAAFETAGCQDARLHPPGACSAFSGARSSPQQADQRYPASGQGVSHQPAQGRMTPNQVELGLVQHLQTLPESQPLRVVEPTAVRPQAYDGAVARGRPHSATRATGAQYPSHTMPQR
mmetsp:Transcript_42378/g.76938  ORF Transcript_42378/g.76938 Transcript_42378/m.76938 type:complete len:1021 (-) Transcript_42378:103-3165(-)